MLVLGNPSVGATQHYVKTDTAVKGRWLSRRSGSTRPFGSSAECRDIDGGEAVTVYQQLIEVCSPDEGELHIY